MTISSYCVCPFTCEVIDLGDASSSLNSVKVISVNEDEPLLFCGIKIITK